MSTRIAILLAAAGCVAVALFVADRAGTFNSWPATDPTTEIQTSESRWFLADALSSLDLSPNQRGAIERIRRSNEAWLETLRQNFELARSASLARIGPDFDRPDTGRRFQRQGDAAAFLWGNQARITTEVATLLKPEQRRALFEYVRTSIDSAPTPQMYALNTQQARRD